MIEETSHLMLSKEARAQFACCVLLQQSRNVGFRACCPKVLLPGPSAFMKLQLCKVRCVHTAGSIALMLLLLLLSRAVYREEKSAHALLEPETECKPCPARCRLYRKIRSSVVVSYVVIAKGWWQHRGALLILPDKGGCTS